MAEEEPGPFVAQCHKPRWHRIGTNAWGRSRHAVGVVDRLPLLDARRVPRLAFAPRLHPLLHRELARLDDPGIPIADTYRRLTAYARALGLFRPSYEHVRRLIHMLRRLRRAGRRGSTGYVLFEITYGLRPPTALVDDLLDTGLAGLT